jgi:hypothetical protein
MRSIIYVQLAIVVMSLRVQKLLAMILSRMNLFCYLIPEKKNGQITLAGPRSELLLFGITAIGRATVLSLRLNNENIVQARAIWIGLNWHPPEN